ncbi:hypothetical protein H4R99_001164 [Coemansia sp. RSA 1722]|nr:hypothetical protein LPJ57_003604 [Coemansia sp. RSA 486]KAJ2605365.1 hypothetical protein H4R99_001164 [Coemansia sp. RSA 1722]
MVFTQAFLKVTQTDKSAILKNRKKPVSEKDIVDSDFIYKGRSYTPYSNTELFQDRERQDMARELRIELCSDMDNTSYFFKAIELLGLTRKREWTGRMAIDIFFNNWDHLPPYSPNHALRSNDVHKHMEESRRKTLEDLATLFAKRVKNPISIRARQSHRMDRDTALMDTLARMYCDKLLAIDITFGIQYGNIRSFDTMVELSAALDKTEGFPRVANNRLRSLKLSKVPFDFDWESFSYLTERNQVEFPRLQALQFQYDEMPENAQLELPIVNQTIIRRDPISEQIKGGSARNNSKLPSHAAGSGKAAMTIHELQDEYRIFDKNYRKGAFPMMSFPKLNQLIIKDCPQLCRMMFSIFSFPSLEKLDYSGAFSGLRLLGDLSTLEINTAKYEINHLDPEEHEAFYQLLNKLCGSRSRIDRVTLSLKNIGHQLDIKQVKWNGLQELYIYEPIEFIELIKLLPRLSSIKNLAVYRVKVSMIYDNGFIKANLKELIQIRKVLGNMSLERLYLYFADEDVGLRTELIMFLLDSLPDLSVFAINRCFEDEMSELVFSHRYFDSSNIIINGKSRNDYITGLVVSGHKS